MSTPGSGSQEVRARIDRYLDEAGLRGRDPQVLPLTGDASDRRYFRVSLRGAPTQVLSVHPGPIDLATLPFVNVARLFEAMPLPVPRILASSAPLGILALDDLGDVTLHAHVGSVVSARHWGLYTEAISFIHTMQRRGAELASAEFVPYALAFDTEKLTFELQFFTTHFLEGHRGVRLSDSTRAALADAYLDVADELAAEPRVLCHRDYHSRNLMLRDGHLHIIDFQDARMGPDTYDLVSLLHDSYVDFEEGQVEALLLWFLAHRDGPAPDVEEFRRRFVLMALQRNLKALGTFGYQASVRGNSGYLQYVPRTLNLVREHLGQHPRFGRLRDLLAAHIAELR
jgi:aminoglycoside/choline kinase family phosphotransferase